MPYKDPAKRREKQKTYAAKWREDNREKRRKSSADWSKRNPEKVRAKQARWAYAHPESLLLSFAKRRAKLSGLDFNIEASDIVIPDVCPVFQVPLKKGTEYAPSLDRLDNDKGYVKGNIWVISVKANKLKRDASLEELKQLVDAWNSKLQDENT